MRRIIIVAIIFSLILSSPLCYSQQVHDCRIVFLNANGIIESHSKVKLSSFKDDILSFQYQDSVYKVGIKDIIKLEYTGKSTSSLGLIIGASVGFILGVTAYYIVSGFASDGPIKRSAGGVALAGLFFATIGGIIGGSIQGTFNERNKINFSGMATKDVRKKLESIFEFYGE